MIQLFIKLICNNYTMTDTKTWHTNRKRNKLQRHWFDQHNITIVILVDDERVVMYWRNGEIDSGLHITNSSCYLCRSHWSWYLIHCQNLSSHRHWSCLNYCSHWDVTLDPPSLPWHNTERHNTTTTHHTAIWNNSHILSSDYKKYFLCKLRSNMNYYKTSQYQVFLDPFMASISFHQ